MRICVIKNKDNTISCIPVSCNKDYYYSKFEVLCFINKKWNLYHVDIIRNYFEIKGFVKSDFHEAKLNKILNNKQEG